MYLHWQHFTKNCMWWCHITAAWYDTIDRISIYSSVLWGELHFYTFAFSFLWAGVVNFSGRKFGGIVCTPTLVRGWWVPKMGHAGGGVKKSHSGGEHQAGGSFKGGGWAFCEIFLYSELILVFPKVEIVIILKISPAADYFPLFFTYIFIFMVSFNIGRLRRTE